MIKLLIGLTLLFFPALLPAQIVMSVQLPPAGIVQKDQLWNVVITNNSTMEYETKLLLSLQSVETGQTILTANTASFSLGKGLKVTSSRDLQPIIYNYTTAGAGTEYLPLGTYVACYTLYRLQQEVVEKLAEECVRLTISPLSPPFLVTPLDKSHLADQWPQFIWTAPAPLDLFSDLNYDLILSEVLPGQTPAQALQYNPSVYSRIGLKATYEPYPASYSRLEAGKTYAWQVIARNGTNYRASTETWTFTLAEDSAEKRGMTPAFVQLKSNRDEAPLSYVSDTLYVQHYSYELSGEATVRFLDADETVLEEKKQALRYGNNFLRFPIGRRYQKRKVYRLSLETQNKQTYSAFFTIN